MGGQNGRQLSSRVTQLSCLIHLQMVKKRCLERGPVATDLLKDPLPMGMLYACGGGALYLEIVMIDVMHAM